MRGSTEEGPGVSIRRAGGMSSPMGSVGWLIFALPLPLSYPALQGCLCAVGGLIVCSIRGGSATANMDERRFEVGGKVPRLAPLARDDHPDRMVGLRLDVGGGTPTTFLKVYETKGF